MHNTSWREAAWKSETGINSFDGKASASMPILSSSDDKDFYESDGDCCCYNYCNWCFTRSHQCHCSDYHSYSGVSQLLASVVNLSFDDQRLCFVPWFRPLQKLVIVCYLIGRLLIACSIQSLWRKLCGGIRLRVRLRREGDDKWGAQRASVGKVRRRIRT